LSSEKIERLHSVARGALEGILDADLCASWETKPDRLTVTR
jgi:hypothetical protein